MRQVCTGVHEAATHQPQGRLTALLHHVDEQALVRAFSRLRRSAASGVDGMTVDAYEHRLMERLHDLHARINSRRYLPQPIRRRHIPQPDAGERSFGILTLEDKNVKGAVAEVRNAFYETDFLDLSPGFRPPRNAHSALPQA